MVEFDANKRRWQNYALGALDQGTAFNVIARGRRVGRLRYYLDEMLPEPKRRSGFRALWVIWREVAFMMVYFDATRRGWTVGYSSPDAKTLLVTFQPGASTGQLH